MSTTTTTEQRISEKDRFADESVRDNQQVAWYARGDGEVFDADSLDTPVDIGEVHELVSVMLKHALFDRCCPTPECVGEVTSQRAWPGFVELIRAVDEDSHLLEKRGSS